MLTALPSQCREEVLWACSRAARKGPRGFGLCAAPGCVDGVGRTRENILGEGNDVDRLKENGALISWLFKGLMAAGLSKGNGR